MQRENSLLLTQPTSLTLANQLNVQKRWIDAKLIEDEPKVLDLTEEERSSLDI